MPSPLPIDWNEAEKACIAGVPINQVAQTMAERAGIDPERLYATMRKRASRERWPMPDAIVRRAKVQAKVATGAAENAKAAALWQAGESGAVAVQKSRDLVGMGVPQTIVDGDGRELSRCADSGGTIAAGGGETAAGGAGLSAGGAFHSVPVTATELVTVSLAERGQSGLSLALDAALAALRNLDPSAPLPVRNAQDLLTMVKATKEAAGLDKPGVAIAVSLNNATNATIAGWAEADTVDTIG